MNGIDHVRRDATWRQGSNVLRMRRVARLPTPPPPRTRRAAVLAFVALWTSDDPVAAAVVERL